MPLELLNIYNVRNLKEFTFKPSPNFNIIHGDNGSGKTTILESIYFLLRTRIFRNNKYKSFINLESSSCTVYSEFSSLLDCDDSYKSFSLGISRTKDNSKPIIHLNKAKVSSLSKISNLVLLGLITPESFNLLDSGPSIRRKFLDWGVFHVEHQFINYWKSYRKILNNRNNLLKHYKNKYYSFNNLTNNMLNDLTCWSPQLIDYNNKLNLLREKQLENIKEYFYEFLNNFSNILADNISLYFYKGWSSTITFEEYINEKLIHDFSATYTRYGTHRSDIIIKYNDLLAKDILSRGQKKIIVICLILAQFKFLNNYINNRDHGLLLLDDMDSELDSDNLNKLLYLLSSMNCQVIMTTTDIKKYKNIENNYKLFHVEQ